MLVLLRRFALVYVALLGFATLIELLPGGATLSDAYARAWLPIARWLGAHWLGPERPVELRYTGSGDTPFHWMSTVAQLGSAGLIAVASGLCRSPNLDRWAPAALHGLVRHLLAVNLIAYGGTKVFDSQFGDLGPAVLVRPLGELSPQVLLWAFMGYSDLYERFAGAIELLAGALLLARRTTFVGAALATAAMTHVFVIDLAYDVPVKLLAMQLLLGAVWLLTLDRPRLAALVSAEARMLPAAAMPEWPSAAARRVARATQAIFLGSFFFGLGRAWWPSDDVGSEDPRLGFHRIEASVGVDRGWRWVDVRESELELHDGDGEPSILPIEALDVERDGDRLVIGGRTDATAFELRLRRVRPEDFRLVRQPRRWIDQRSTMWDP